jgi:hypothetical protein
MLIINLFGKTPADIENFYLASNKSPKAIPYIESRMREIRCQELSLASLSSHPHACHILRKNREAINMGELCVNESAEALELLLQTFDHEEIDWHLVAGNQAIGERECEIIRRIMVPKNGDPPENYHCLMHGLARNPSPAAVRLFLELFSEEEEWDELEDSIATNSAPEAIAILRRHLKTVDPFYISQNHAAVPILEAHPELIDMESICYNPYAVHLVEERIDEMKETDWHYLCLNPSRAAIDLLVKNQDKVSWNYLSMNPMIFEVVEDGNVLK